MSISEVAEPEIAQTEDGSDVLVVVFSQTGHTMGIAQMIAEIEDADLYEIVPAVPYTDEDLNYNDSSSRATAEQNDPSVRPEIGSDPIEISGYTRIYIGYPIWWGQEPRIMDTFAESYDFADATVIPFCTSGSSGIGQSGSNLAAAAGSGNWIEGMRFPSDASEDDVRAWINELPG
ncbi:MAG: flavodoxin [Clostridiales bacterium]|nr:flavodoxin [Clostridiales bacterium]